MLHDFVAVLKNGGNIYMVFPDYSCHLSLPIISGAKQIILKKEVFTQRIVLTK